jgi:CRISPR/Cas system-associated exonuclease Cas4 (RecB family)
MDFVDKFPNLKPYRTEWTIFDKSLKLAGSIDMVFIKENNHLMIYDWKRCKNISKTNPWWKYAITESINYLPDSNFWIYSLQLNTYKAIIEKNYGFIVDELYLVCLHPDNKTFLKIKVADLQKEVAILFQERINKINNLKNLKQNHIV